MTAYTATLLTRHNSVRISAKLLKALPAEVAQAVKDVQSGHPNVKSLNLLTVTPDYTFYVGEGNEFTLILGEAQRRMEVVAEHNSGAAGLLPTAAIGHEFKAPEGAWVLRVSYYTRYWLDVYNVQPRQL